MKVYNYTCLFVAATIVMISSVSNAQSGSRRTVPQAVQQVVPQAETVTQEALSYYGEATADNMVVGETIMPAQPTYGMGPGVIGTGSSCYMPAPSIQECHCCKESCTRCRHRQKRTPCRCKRLGCQGECTAAVAPTSMFQSCEGDFCKLDIKKGKETKTCFKTEQVPVCIPAVRLPWQKCCPPSKSRTRLVTKLKTEKYECDSCSYKWSVEETNNCGTTATAAPAAEKSQEPTKADKPDAKSDVEKAIEENVVPPAPAAKGAFLRTFRRR